MRPLTIVSYNLRDWGKPPVDGERQAAQVELLGQLKPDVLMVQELWDDSGDAHAPRRRLTELADALGMVGEVALAPRSHCHLGALWRPELACVRWRDHPAVFWHNLGAARLDLGGWRLRVAVAHLNPYDPDDRLGEVRRMAHLADPAEATVVAADWNTIGEDVDYDEEPDWSRLPPHLRYRHVVWDADPTAALRADRRPTALLSRLGLVDAARHLARPWQPTCGYADHAVPRRIDAFRVSAPVLPVLTGYRVIDSPAARELSDHLPIVLELDPGRLRPVPH